jgi:hypothetical protein
MATMLEVTRNRPDPAMFTPGLHCMKKDAPICRSWFVKEIVEISALVHVDMLYHRTRCPGLAIVSSLEGSGTVWGHRCPTRNCFEQELRM